METPRSARRSFAAVLAVALVLVLPGASPLARVSSVVGGGADLRTALVSSEAAGPAAITASRKHPKPKVSPVTSVNPSLARVNNSRSKLGWVSGVYVPGSDPGKIAAFGAWRHAGADVAVDWPARSSWSDIIAPEWLYQAWHGTPYTKVFGVAPLPENDPTATMAGCAAGTYNSKWTQFGRNIKAAGLDDESVIRLGWEFNGDWYKWQARNPAQFARCWRQIVGTVRKVAPKLLWDWSVNRGVGSAIQDARKAYPGNAYVDIVGVDSYDMYPAATGAAGWQQQYAGPYGLKFWSDFAAAHGKKLSVPEWGVYPGTAHAGHNGGDNPYYIAKMGAFFAAEGRRLAYEAYFNESAPYYAGSLYGPTQNPRAAARYRAVFGH